MQESTTSLQQNKKASFGIPASTLKQIAVLSMLIDHVTAGLYDRGYWAAGNPVTAQGRQLYYILRGVGRIAFPIYCFLLVEGFLHTHDRKKYGLNLLAFALISEIPWDLEHTGNLQYPVQNVFFTLFLGYAGLCCIEELRDKPWEQLISLVAVALAAMNLNADYGLGGFAFILVMYLLREEKILQAVVGTCIESGGWAAGLAFIPINLYNGKRGFIKGKVMKYAFYAAYPVHILIIYLIRKKTVGF